MPPGVMKLFPLYGISSSLAEGNTFEDKLSIIPFSICVSLIYHIATDGSMAFSLAEAPDEELVRQNYHPWIYFEREIL